MSEFKFITIYVFFVFFLLFLVSLGIPIIAEAEGLTIPILEAPTGNIFEDLGATFSWFLSYIDFYIQLTEINSGLSVVNFIIFAPTTILLIYIFITKLAIPFLEAIGSLIPFT